MSREIKFRVFVDNKMFYQDKYNAYSDNLASIDICKKTITITGFHNYENVYRFEDEKVKLMQYTGVKDKNGKEIYEGDIIICKYGPQIAMEVKWVDEGFRTLGKYDGDNYVGFVKNNAEVIGNIYENKNLLEENKWVNTK